jgi:hypothetical protein
MPATVKHSNPARQVALQNVANTRSPSEPGIAAGSSKPRPAPEKPPLRTIQLGVARPKK